MQTSRVKLVVFVPESHCDLVRNELGKVGAGKIGDYTYCSFSSPGFGRFIPGDSAIPHIGQNGKPEIVPEERIEFLCERENLKVIVEALLRTHPYDEVAYDIYPVEDFDV